MIRSACVLFLSGVVAVALGSAPALAQTTPAPDAPPQVAADPNLAASLAAARALDGYTEYERAAGAYEGYAADCLASSTALLQPGMPCAEAGDALERALELRRALGHRERAARDAESYVAHFLYARPRAAIRVRVAIARMYLDAGELARATEAVDLLDETHADAPGGLDIISSALRARLAHARGEPGRASRAWRRVERAWEAEREDLQEDGAVPLAWIREAVAEGRLLRAERSVERYLAVRRPRSRRMDNTRRWWSDVMSPWLVRSRRRLVLARAELERVYEMGSPRHSVIAAARIGEMYEHQADLHSDMTLPDNELIRGLVNGGEPTPGYDQARAHLETCVRWASHHGVAREWAERCEARLHDLDPVMYPQQAELYREQPYVPVAGASPSPDVD